MRTLPSLLPTLPAHTTPQFSLTLVVCSFTTYGDTMTCEYASLTRCGSPREIVAGLGACARACDPKASTPPVAPGAMGDGRVTVTHMVPLGAPAGAMMVVERVPPASVWGRTCCEGAGNRPKKGCWPPSGLAVPRGGEGVSPHTRPFALSMTPCPPWCRSSSGRGGCKAAKHKNVLPAPPIENAPRKTPGGAPAPAPCTRSHCRQPPCPCS